MKQYNAQSAAALFGLPVANIKKQYAENAKQLRACEAISRKSGKAYRGKTTDQWNDYAAKYEKLAS